MKYDLFDQKLVINYWSSNKQINFLLPDKFISQFSLNHRHFEHFTIPGAEQGFFQVISDNEKLKCLYYWYKKRTESNHNVDYASYEFSKAMKKNYLAFKGTYYSFKNKHQFIKYFPDEIQTNVKLFLKHYRINIRKCGDDTMLRLISFCNSLLEK